MSYAIEFLMSHSAMLVEQPPVGLWTPLPLAMVEKIIRSLEEGETPSNIGFLIDGKVCLLEEISSELEGVSSVRFEQDPDNPRCVKVIA